MTKQQTWEKRLDQWIKTQYGTAGDTQKLKSFIQAELQRQRESIVEIVDFYIENSASPLTMCSCGQDYMDGYNRMAQLEKQAFKHLKGDIIKKVGK
jgi:oligoribonuclease (3'-5' exoribonuclease)